MKNRLAEKLTAFLLLLSAFLLIYNPLTKFPYTFCVIIAYVLLTTLWQDRNLSSLNFKKITARHAGIIFLCYLLLEISMDLIFQPLVNRVFNEPADYTAFERLRGNSALYFRYLLFMWISAAAGEEILFRAFVFAQGKKIIGNRPVLVIVLSALLFAIPHLYQGYAGATMTFLFGLAFGVIYHRFQHLWINIIVHGLIDTVFLTLAYFGSLEFYNLYG